MAWSLSFSHAHTHTLTRTQCKFNLTTIYIQLGSTEWVEENREMLASRAVAYLNVDCAVAGPGFYASATPQLDELLKRATQEVSQKL